MPFDSKTIRLATKSTPLILRFTFGHSSLWAYLLPEN
jgi:hypothetical protein